MAIIFGQKYTCSENKQRLDESKILAFMKVYLSDSDTSPDIYIFIK